MRSMWDPWTAASDEWPLVAIRSEPLPGRRLGEIRDRGTVIVLRAGITRAQATSTLAHELVHLERGLLGCRGQWRAREEFLVHAEAARRLIPLCSLADALRHVGSDEERHVATVLGVDRYTLRVRVSGLTELERAGLGRLLRRCEWVA